MPQKIKGDNQCAIAEKPLSNFQWRKALTAHHNSMEQTWCSLCRKHHRLIYLSRRHGGVWIGEESRDHVPRLQLTSLHKPKPSFWVHQFGHNFSLYLEYGTLNFKRQWGKWKKGYFHYMIEIWNQSLPQKKKTVYDTIVRMLDQTIK